MDHLHEFRYKSMVSLFKSFSPIHDSVQPVMSVMRITSSWFLAEARSPFLLLQYAWASNQVFLSLIKAYLSSPALVRHTPLMGGSVCSIRLLIDKQSKVTGFIFFYLCHMSLIVPNNASKCDLSRRESTTFTAVESLVETTFCWI